LRAGYDRRHTGGFTLLEVLIAVAILAISLSSLLGSQMAAMRATRYARGVSVAAFLAEHQLLEIEYEMQRLGWVLEDKSFDGDFSEQGHKDIRYECMVDFVELPDYTALQKLKNVADTDGTDNLSGVQETEDQAFDALGMVWPIVKGAVEMAIRKARCTVYWTDGNVEHDFMVETYWTDVEQLKQLPQAGGEATEADDTRTDDGGEPGGGEGRGTTPGGGSAGPGIRPGGGMGPTAPGGGR
jgi:type II secretion system protein I